SPDGKRLATANWDGTIKLWDTATGAETLTLRGHTAGVNCLAFSPDGTRLASGSIDHTVRIWDATPLRAEALREREARFIAALYYVEHPLKSEVAELIRANPELDEATRAAALAAAEQLRPVPNRLRLSTLEIASNPSYGHEDYLRALRRADALLELDAESAMAMVARGIALYRLGRYPEALVSFRRAQAGIQAGALPPDPSCLAFQAMAHQHLNQGAEARACLERLRTVLKTVPSVDHSNSRLFLQEAEALIEPGSAR